MWLEKIYHRILYSPEGMRANDVETLQNVSKQIAGNVLCALGDFATSPVVSTIQHYKADYDARLVNIGKR